MNFSQIDKANKIFEREMANLGAVCPDHLVVPGVSIGNRRRTKSVRKKNSSQNLKQTRKNKSDSSLTNTLESSEVQDLHRRRDR